MGAKAWRVESPGGDFQTVDIPRPAIKPNQVLVKIAASGVNPLDTKIRAGKAAHAQQPLPAVLGLDTAGTVEEVGTGVTAFQTGDEVYGMVGGVGGLQGTLAEFIALDASFTAAKRYTGHVLSCLGWGSHSLAPLSFRGATYSGVFTLLPLLRGEGHAHHGEILREAAALAEAGKLKPLLNERRFSTNDIATAHANVESGFLGKVVIEL